VWFGEKSQKKQKYNKKNVKNACKLSGMVK
jgi:hypothetical protein